MRKGGYMSPVLRFLAFCSLFASFWAFGQNLQYKIQGSLSSLNTPDPANPVLINYSIEWNETDNSLQGVYQDNYYATTPRAVTGTVTTGGRNFLVILPEVNNGVKVIELTTSQSVPTNGSIPIVYRSESSVEAAIDNVTTFAIMSAPSVVIATPDSNGCAVGFGSLTGYCGLYSGTFNKRSDPNNRCNLTTMGEPRLEVATSTNFNLYLNYVNTLEDIPFHNLGTFVFSPTGNSVLLNRRVCEDLPGTTFASGNCKTLSMDLNYFNQAGVLRFTGTYRITDEVMNESCVYDLSVTREIPY